MNVIVDGQVRQPARGGPELHGQSPVRNNVIEFITNVVHGPGLEVCRKLKHTNGVPAHFAVQMPLAASAGEDSRIGADHVAALAATARANIVRRSSRCGSSVRSIMAPFPGVSSPGPTPELTGTSVAKCSR